MSDIPTFSECVIGYRAWGVDPFLRLWPLTGWGGKPWVPGINQAECGRDRAEEIYGVGVMWMSMGGAAPGHSAPDQQCGCGLYCRRRLHEVIEEIEEIEWPTFEEIRNPVLPGAVAVWGDLCVHRDGFRASHACVVALGEMPDMPHQMRSLARAVAHKYGVPLVPIDALEAEASKSGTPLPDDIGPPPRRPGVETHTWASLTSLAGAAGAQVSSSGYITFSTAAPPRRTLSRRSLYANAGASVVNLAAYLFWTHWLLNLVCVAIGAVIVAHEMRQRRKSP